MESVRVHVLCGRLGLGDRELDGGSVLRECTCLGMVVDVCFKSHLSCANIERTQRQLVVPRTRGEGQGEVCSGGRIAALSTHVLSSQRRTMWWVSRRVIELYRGIGDPHYDTMASNRSHRSPRPSETLPAWVRIVVVVSASLDCRPPTESGVLVREHLPPVTHECTVRSGSSTPQGVTRRHKF